MCAVSITSKRRAGLLPRWAHFLYARALGYSWTPCPLCGVAFGGHELREINGNMSSIPIPGAAICPTCTRAGRAHAPGRDRDGSLLHTGELVSVIGEGWGLFITPAADGSEGIFVWLLASRRARGAAGSGCPRT